MRRTIIILVCLACLPMAASAAETGTADPKNDLRQPWTRPEDGFLRSWLILGPLPSPATAPSDRQPLTGLDEAFFKDAGDEAAIIPQAGQTAQVGETRVAWKTLTTPKDIIDLCEVCASPGKRVVAYAFTTFANARAESAFLSLGSDDGVKVYLNGRLVHRNAMLRGVHLDEDVVPVDLVAGDNRLLLKVESLSGGWGFACRVLRSKDLAGHGDRPLQPRLDGGEELVVIPDSGLGTMSSGGQAVSVEILAPGGRTAAQTTTTRNGKVRFDRAALAEGPYEIRLSRQPETGPREFAHLAWYQGDYLAACRRLLDEVDRLPADAAEEDALRRLVLRDFILDALKGDPRRDLPAAGWPARPPPHVHAALMEAGEIALAQEPGPLAFHRLAWRDAVDGSAQYARAYLPPQYAPGRRWPLVVQLHGYNPPNPTYVRWWSAAKRHDTLSERHGVIMLEPHGRGNSGYVGIGEADVLRAIAEAKRRFSIDDDRIYLMGYSMGGSGAWWVGSRHPELFAAIGPIYGGWDARVWMEAGEYARLTPAQRLRKEAESSFAQAEALLSTPVFVNHGDADPVVSVDNSRFAVRMLQRWGYEIGYREHPGLGHGGLVCEDDLLRWFLARTRQAHPRQVRLRSGDLAGASAHWLRVEQAADPYALIRADARIVDRRTVKVDSDNVLQFRLAPDDALIDAGEALRVVWNGRPQEPQRLEGGSLTLRAAGYQAALGDKTPAICGPLAAATRTPFLIVEGSISPDPLMRRICGLRAAMQRRAWLDWQRVEPRFKRDVEVTPEEMQAYSLILFGGPAENAVTARLAARLPVAIGAGQVVVDGRTLPAEEAALAFYCPHPLNPARCIVVHAGSSPGGMYLGSRLGDGHDYIVSDLRVAPEGADDEDVGLLAGSFDAHWRFSEAFARRPRPALREAARRRTAPSCLAATSDQAVLPLDEVLENEATGAFARMERNLDCQGGTITMDGKAHARGLAVGTRGEAGAISYELGGRWRRLKATIGLNPEKPLAELDPQQLAAGISFVVFGDGRELYRSPTVRCDSPALDVDVELAGVQVLRLEVDRGPGRLAVRSVNWADIRLEAR